MRAPFYLAIASLAGLQGTAVLGADGADGGVHLIPMDRFDLPIVEGDRANGRLRFKLVLRAADAAGAARITADLPALREVTLATGAEFARLHASPFVPVDARRLAADMTIALQAHDHGIAGVLLVEVSAARV